MKTDITHSILGENYKTIDLKLDSNISDFEKKSKICEESGHIQGKAISGVINGQYIMYTCKRCERPYESVLNQRQYWLQHLFMLDKFDI